MSINLSTRLKVALLLCGLLLSILTVAIISDTWRIRSHTPTARTDSSTTGGTVLAPPGSKPGPSHIFGNKAKPLFASSKGADDEVRSGSDSGIAPPTPTPSSTGGGGGGGGGGIVPEILPPDHLDEIKLLFKADKPVPFDFKDPKLLQTDFVSKLPDIPLRKSGFVGIKNKGNSCYANSALQMFYRVPFIRKVVANFEVYYELAKINLKEKVTQFKSLSGKTDTASKAKRATLRGHINDLVAAVKVLEGLNHMFYQLHTGTGPASYHSEKTMQCMPGKFAGSNQEDTDEYMAIIFGSIKDILPESQYHHLGLDLITSDTECDPTDPSYVFKRDDKKTLSTKLSLLPNYGATSENLLDLLDKNFAEEILTDISLENGKKGTIKRQNKMGSPTETLVIHLNRILDFRNKIKISHEITMPLDLDIGKWVDDGKTSVKYRLKMFIEHQGGDGCGHFVSYHREADGTWNVYNDSSVYKCSDIDSKLKIGYIYFYERIY